jgi:hypothetical protein
MELLITILPFFLIRSDSYCILPFLRIQSDMYCTHYLDRLLEMHREFGLPLPPREASPPRASSSLRSNGCRTVSRNENL